MFLTVHAAAGAIIGRELDNSFVAFFLGLASHFILDMIPHGDENFGKKFFGIQIRGRHDLKLMALYGAIDSFCLVIFIIFLFKNFDFAYSDPVIWSIIGAILPDIIMAIYKIHPFKFLRWFYDFHSKNHRLIIEKAKNDIPLHYGIIFQIFIMSLFIWIIFL